MSDIHEQNKRINPIRPLLIPIIAFLGFMAMIQFLSFMKNFDAIVIHVVHLLPSGLDSLGKKLSILGSPPFLVFLALCVTCYEMTRRRWIRAAVMALSLLALPAFFLLKELVHRARPVTEFVTTSGLHDYSFPSGHATGSAAIYGMIIYLVLSDETLNPAIKRAAVTIASSLIILIGLSRVYIGAHFPSDIIGGWLLALLVISLLRAMSLGLVKKYDKPLSEAVPSPNEVEVENNI